MRTYGQYCPIARAAEIFGERWTPLIIRNIHAGCSTYGEILAGAPGLSHTLLTQRLRHLARLGIVSARPKDTGPGVRYELTAAGHDLWPVLLALGAWGEQWVELRDEHTNPRFLLWTWSTTYLAVDSLPSRQVVVRFELSDRSPDERAIWLIVRPTDAEVCTKPPKFEEDLVVETTAMTLARWHPAARVGSGVAVRRRTCCRSPRAGRSVADLEPTRGPAVAARRRARREHVLKQRCRACPRTRRHRT
jgi:DNA-binding HxlR family transcriptional regulator